MNYDIKKSRKALALTITNIRKSKGLTQESCAKGLGVTQANWSAYEVGKSSPSFDTIVSFSTVLDVSLVRIFIEFLSSYRKIV